MQKLTEEKTFVIVKPDGVKRGLVGEVIRRIEQRGLKIIALEMIWATRPEIDRHDPNKIGLKVRGWLLDFMTEGPVVKIAIEGVHAIRMVRKIVGQTIPAFAEMGTIRGDYSIDSPALANAHKRAVRNLIHA